MLLLLAIGAALLLTAPQTSATAGEATARAAAPPPAARRPAGSGPSAQALAARADGIADEVVTRWASQQQSDGRFPDPVLGGGGDYGTAMLGLAMARRGVEQGNRALLRGGLQALLAQVEQPSNGSFELLVLARAQHWASQTLPGDPLGAPLWAEFGPRLSADLQQRGPVTANPNARNCNEDSSCYNNLKLVANLGELELLATGLTPSTPTALLADPQLRANVIARLATRVPQETGRAITRRGSAALAGGGILSDPPRNPLAYSALSTAMLGQLVSVLGPAAPPPALRALDRAARGLLLLAAPDGDLSYWGRGQGQVWVPAVVADAAASAAERSSSTVMRGRYLALAEAALGQLRTRYGVGSHGLPLVPGAVDAAVLTSRRVDAYASTRSYNGLAVDALDRAAATLLRIRAATATSVPAGRDGVVRSPAQAGLATLTRGPLWAAVGAKSRSNDEDARYGSGLLALQFRNAAGDWAPILPGRPYSPTTVSTLAVESDGITLVPDGVVGASRGTSVELRGGWANRRLQPRKLDPGTRWRWQLVGDNTLEVRFTARAARTVVATGLVGEHDALRRTPRGFVVTAPDGGAIAYSLEVAGRRLPLARARLAVGASAFDAWIEASQLRGRVRRGERVVLRVKVVAAPVVAAG